MVETSLMVPMVFFLFLALVNFGFYIYAFIVVGNAARAAAQHISLGGPGALACPVVLREMQTLPNVYSTCTGDVTVATVTATTTFGGSVSAQYREVTITYNTIQLFPLPFMSGQMTINRTARMRVKIIV